MQIKTWNIKCKETKGSLIERLLAARGITKKEDIETFLKPLEYKIIHPNAFVDMQKAVERLAKAIDNHENITIYGDFDADGVTSTSVLIRTLKELGGEVKHYIPSRETEGHGLDKQSLVKLLTSQKPKVLITVDCGISNVEEVAFLNSFKVDVILTDHHEAPETLPKALAIINPKAQDALDEKLTTSEIISLTSLAGVGVAFKLAHALLEHYNKMAFIYDILPYVTVGTVADVVPLVGENRYFVARGLQLISEGKHYGLKRLLESAGYVLDEGITSEQIAFGVAPRINASGRLGTVDDALKLLISDNKQEIEMAVISLNELNKVRQELCSENSQEAEEMYRRSGMKDNAIVLFNPKWQVGIVGIVASKMVEKFYKPAFLMTYSEETQQYRCSARGIEGLNLYDIISANEELLDGFGGHALAAGLYFTKEKSSFEQVKKALNKTVTEMLGDRKLTPTLNVDMELTNNDLTVDLVDEIAKLEPFGECNPSPVFAMKDLILKQKKLMGSNNDHLKLTVQANDETFDCIWWSKGDISLVAGDRLDIAFTPQINTFRGNTSLQLILQDVHSDMLVEEDIQPDIKIYDHRNKTDILPTVNDYVKSAKFNISVFAENKGIVSSLKPYNALFTRVKSRVNIEKSDAIMFFDYPSDEDCFNEIIAKVEPKVIHYMNYCAKKFDENEFLKTLSGMIRYACNNSDGNFPIEKCAAFLSQSTDTIKIALETLADCGMIEIQDKLEDAYKLKFIQNIETSKALHSSLYSEFLDSVEQTELFRDELLEKELI